MRKSQLIIFYSVSNVKLGQEFYISRAKNCSIKLLPRVYVCFVDKVNTKFSSVFCMCIKRMLLRGGVTSSQNG